MKFAVGAVAAFVVAFAVLLAAPVFARTDTGTSGPTPISYRKASSNTNERSWITLGTSAAPCLANGTSASSVAIPAGRWRLAVFGEAVAICDGNDADCASTPASLPINSIHDIVVGTAQAGTFHCRSATPLGFVTFTKLY
jgi:hypothetical protein